MNSLTKLVEDIDFATAVIFCSSVDAVEAVTYKLGSRAVEALALVGRSSVHVSLSHD